MPFKFNPLTGSLDLVNTSAWGDITGDITNQLDLQTAFSKFALTTDLAAKAPLNSPALTGTPTTPTALNGSNNTTIANTKYVDTGLSGKASVDNAMGRVDHGTINSVARPASYYSIQWVGSVEPLNATEFDTWLDSSG